jgi:glycosyltransferase involved in cell wall biosynthesis
MSTAPEPPTLLSVFATFAVGGAQVRFAAVANRLGRRLRHTIVAMDGNIAGAERLDPSLDLSFPAMPIVRGRVSANLRHFRAFLQTHRPSMLVTHNWGSIDWAIARMFTGIPHIHIADGFGPEESARQIRRRVWVRRLVLRASTVVVPSRTLERIAHRSWLVPDVRYVPNGIDLAHLAAPRRRTPEVPVIGTVAALRPEKNLSRLILACARLRRPYRLVIVGDGPERTKLQALAAEVGLGDRVEFPGYVADPAPLYAKFDVVAMSSDTEQMPLCALEAMAAGLPVAATDVGDIAMMLAPENRPFVVQQDGAELAMALKTLLGDPGLRDTIGRANRARAEAEFDQEAMFAAYAQLFGVDYPPAP